VESGGSFSSDARVGPWGPVLAADSDFARRFAASDPKYYHTMVTGIARVMFDRDTVPGPEPEDLMALKIPALVIPGHDDSHATSAARYLEECLALSQYWDVAVPDQSEPRVAQRLAEFLSEAAR
jgi:hypothetical protein